MTPNSRPHFLYFGPEQSICYILGARELRCKTFVESLEPLAGLIDAELENKRLRQALEQQAGAHVVGLHSRACLAIQ